MSKLTKKPTDNLLSKQEEIRFTTSNLEEARNHYTAKRIVRTWKEKFIDEDTGEEVDVPRNEILMDRGVFLDNQALSELNFYFQSGDLTEIEVSNIQRLGVFEDLYTTIWAITLQIRSEKKTLYLYAKSVHQALEITQDYAEQTYEGHLSFIQTKALSNLILVSDIYEDENTFETEKPKAYKIELEITTDNGTRTDNFMVFASNAEQGKIFIDRFIQIEMQKQNDYQEFTSIILSAKQMPCEAIIDKEFCMKYIGDDNDKL